METRTPSDKWNAQIHEAACEWFVEFRAGEPGEGVRKRFHAWLVDSPAHMAAYLEVAALWNESGEFDGAARWSVDELVARANEGSGNVVALGAGAPAPSPALSRSAERVDADTGHAGAAAYRAEGDGSSAVGAAAGSKQISSAAFRKVGLAASIVLAFIAVLGWFVLEPDTTTYATQIGEQQVLTLPDGSTVRLNARSTLRVQFSRSERNVELLQGQALFQVAKDTQRPFTVTSDSTRVRAVGTEFDVHRKRSSVVVTVVEGRVQVGSAYLSAGEQITMSPTAQGAPKPVDSSVATAWTQRQLVFEGTPLADVVDAFNRYNTRPLVIRDPTLESFEIDGVFSSPDPAPLIRFLESRPDVRVVETDSAVIIQKQAETAQ
jgi:transmembrane sensor